ncbi:ATP-binding cassette domain-containing protein [Blautia sp.]|uniref:ATP-binding cassette domain-containing protein n=1 Tax=Blautia sp. TaxID=1955243 RepID=UPI002586232A|nr:ATP-binding cassette domain-containing protein [Blautia sp.]
MKISAFSKTYGSMTVLNIPELHFQPGKIYSIIGPNGSGKSTFAKILAGTLTANQKKKPLDSAISVGYLPQKTYAFRMSTQSNILLGNKDPKRAEYLMRVLQISGLASKRANCLSGGETARMALARLMMKQFHLVILDEPTAAMDMEATFLSEKLIQEYTGETNCALVLITHSLQQAKRIADEVYFFHNGTLWESGPKDNILSAPARPETRQFLDFYGA